MWIHTLLVHPVLLCVKCQYTLYLRSLSCVWNVNTHYTCVTSTPVCEMSIDTILVYSVSLCVKCEYSLLTLSVLCVYQDRPVSRQDALWMTRRWGTGVWRSCGLSVRPTADPSRSSPWRWQRLGTRTPGAQSSQVRNLCCIRCLLFGAQCSLVRNLYSLFLVWSAVFSKAELTLSPLFVVWNTFSLGTRRVFFRCRF